MLLCYSISFHKYFDYQGHKLYFIVVLLFHYLNILVVYLISFGKMFYFPFCLLRFFIFFYDKS